MSKEDYNKKELDKDTQKALRKGEIISDFVKSEGWKIAKNDLIKKLIDIDSVNSFTKIGEKSAEEIKQEMLTRKAVIDLILEWIKEIEGNADIHETNKKMFENREDSYINQY